MNGTAIVTCPRSGSTNSGREESFFGHVHRHPARLYYEHGATREGRLVYVKAEIVLDGSLLVALPVALLAGLVSFASPCVLPLVPGYLGYVTGLTGADLVVVRARAADGPVWFTLVPDAGQVRPADAVDQSSPQDALAALEEDFRRQLDGSSEVRPRSRLRSPPREGRAPAGRDPRGRGALCCPGRYLQPGPRPGTLGIRSSCRTRCRP